MEIINLTVAHRIVINLGMIQLIISNKVVIKTHFPSEA